MSVSQDSEEDIVKKEEHLHPNTKKAKDIRYGLKKNTGKLVLCLTCERFYEESLTVNVEYGITCYHCLFWLNYAPEIRSSVDGVYGMTIYDYIQTFAQGHDTNKCQRRGCFICDFINGKDIEGILTPENSESDDVDQLTIIL